MRLEKWKRKRGEKKEGKKEGKKRGTKEREKKVRIGLNLLGFCCHSVTVSSMVGCNEALQGAFNYLAV